MTKDEAIEELKKRFPRIDYIHDAEEWGGEKYKEAIHLGDCAEGGVIDNIYAADYYSYAHDPKEKFYILGFHKKLIEALDELGYFPEFLDPGTAFAWPK